MTTKKPQKNMFVDNERMYAMVCRYIQQVERAEKYGVERPPINKQLAMDIRAIAESLSHRHNFRNYPFRDDMVQDGIEHVVRYLHRFDTEKFDNVFGWVTTILWQNYGNRISLEKKQLYLKFKATMNYHHELSYLIGGGGAAPSVSGADVQFVNDFIEDYEASMEKKKANAKRAKQQKETTLEDEFEDDEE